MLLYIKETIKKFSYDIRDSLIAVWIEVFGSSKATLKRKFCILIFNQQDIAIKLTNPIDIC